MRICGSSIICTANRALNHEVSRDARMLAVNESGLDRRQTPFFWRSSTFFFRSSWPASTFFLTSCLAC